MIGTSEMARDELVERIRILEEENTRLRQSIQSISSERERFELVINGAQEGVWDWNLLTNEIYFSARWKSMLGYTEEELPNVLETWSTLVHPDDLQNAIDAIEGAIKHPCIPYESIHRLRHKEGHYIWNLDRGQVIYDEEGTAVRMIGSHSDISHIVELEKEVKLLKTAIVNAPMSFVITDSQGIIQYVNPWFTKVTGYTLEEAIGESPHILKSGFTSNEEYELLWNEITHEHVWRGTFKNLKKSGEEYWENAIIVPLKDDLGKITNYLGIKQEITAEIQLRDRVIQQDVHIAHLAGVLEYARIEIYIFDAVTLRFVYANQIACAHTGYTTEELSLKTPLEIKQIEKEELTSYISKLEETDTVTFESIHYRKDGSSYPVSIVLQASYYKDAPVYVAMVSDISDYKQALKESFETQELMIAQSRHAAMGEMIGMIAHQWRQPLGIVSMIINNMMMDIELEELNKASCIRTGENIMSQINYLSKTIDDFRNFFRPNKEHDRIRIVDIIDECESMIGASFTNSGITLAVTNESGSMIETYSRELLQVFINILKNAKEAVMMNAGARRTITIHIFETPEWVCTEICDGAGGIAPAIMEKIFDPYFSTKDEKVGTGLGLYMSKTIVEKHLKGTIAAENCNDGVCFTIRLPKN